MTPLFWVELSIVESYLDYRSATAVRLVISSELSSMKFEASKSSIIALLRLSLAFVSSLIFAMYISLPPVFDPVA